MSGMVNWRAIAMQGLVLSVATALAAMPPAARAGLGRPRIDPTQVVPLAQIPQEYHAAITEVIKDHTFHRQSPAESFPCSAGLYLSLVNEPLLTLALWKDLAESPVQLRKLSANRYEGSDGAGSTATWDYVLRTPRMHVMIASFVYASPRGSTRIEARVLLVVHSGYYREVNGEPYIQHDVEAFVKIDSKGWKTLARTVRPMIERVLEDQVREAGLFISVMSKLVVVYPNWATQVALAQEQIDARTRQKFREIVAQNRRPDASEGRPVVASGPTATETARR